MKELNKMMKSTDEVNGAIKKRLMDLQKDKINDGLYDCEKCGNRGFQLLYIDDELVYEKCQCYEIRNARRKMRDLGLLRFLDEHNSFKNFKATTDWQRKIKKTAVEFVDDPHNKFFYIGGQVGSGKTILCATILSQLIEKYYRTNYDYIIWGDIIRTLAFDDKNKQEMNYYKNCDVLFIDDFLRNCARNELNIQNYEREIAMELINYRYLNKKVTIISSELYYQELEQIDDAIASRIRENADDGKFVLSIKRDKERNIRTNKNVLI